MEYIELGKTGEKIPAIGMGTWKLGDEKEGIEALTRGAALGGNLIDTAEMYGTEHTVGMALSAGTEAFVATKVSPNHLHHDEVIRACERSLKALGIKTIDLYQIHWPNPRIPIRETISAMEELVDSGRIRYIGVSNFSKEELQEAQEAAKRNEIVSNQVEYSVFERNPERGLSDYCSKEKITIIAYSPLGQGRLYSHAGREAMGALAEIGRRHGKTPGQVALNWLIEKGNVSAIPKSSNAAHAEENMGSAGWRLSKEEYAAINRIGQH